jgi:ribose transport system permease protein
MERSTKKISTLSRVIEKTRTVNNFGLYLVFAGIVVFFSIASPYFFSLGNFMDIFRQSTFVLVAAMGMTIVIITAGIDLSVGSVIGLSAGVTSLLLINGTPTAAAVAAGLVTGLLCGLINGLVITRLGVTDLITTLSTLSIYRGILFMMTHGIPFQAFARPGFSMLGRGNLGFLPVPIIISAFLFIILWYFLNKTIMGRHIFSVGSNAEAARLSGINVKKNKVYVYMISGFTAAASGIMLASRLSSVPPDLGQGYEMSVIAAVVIGGTSLFGGRGSLVGTVIGSLMVAIIGNGLILLNVNPFYQYIINGLIIIAAVSFNNARSKNT